MTDAWLTTLALTIPLVALAVFDIRVARRVRAAAAIRPRQPFLNLVSIIVTGIAIGATVGAILGIQNVVFNVWGVRLLPPPLPLVAIYVALIAGSLSLIPLRRQIRRWETEIPPEPEA